MFLLWWMCSLFTPKRISPDCLFKSNHRQGKIAILILQCAIYLHGMLHTAKIISTVCCTPLRLSPRYFAHLREHLRGVLHTAEIVSVVCTEIISAVWCTPPRSSLRYVAHRGEDLCGVLHTVEIISAVCCTPRRSTKSKHNSKILKPVYQWPRWVRIMKKTGGPKSRDTLPLNLGLKLQQI